MGNQQAAAKPLPNDIEVAWTKNKAECPYPPLEGQASAVIGSKIYLFGGVTADMEESNSLYIYDVISNEWSRKDQEQGGGDVVWPIARSGAAMSSLGDHLYVFGGLSQEKSWLNDFFTYDTKQGVWSVIPTTSCRPSPRDKASMCTAGGKLWLFGGFHPKSGEPVCDVTPEDVIEDDGDGEYEDIDDDVDVRRAQTALMFGWSDQLFSYHNGEWTEMTNNSDSAPTGRCAHAMTTTSTDGKVMVYVLGGRDSEGRQKDLWVYDSAGLKWSLVYCNGEHPAQASYLNMAAYGNRLVAYGGRGVNEEHFDKLHVLDLDTCNWMQPKVTSDDVTKPPAMGMHHICVVDDVIVMLGGSSGFKQGFCSDFHRSVYHMNAADVLRGGVVKPEISTEETPEGATNGVMTS